MPPDSLQSGVLDEDGAAPVGPDIAKDSNKIKAEPGPLLVGSKYCMLAVVLRPSGPGLSPSMVSTIWLRIGCVSDPERRARLERKWEAGECFRERSAVLCCWYLLVHEAMLARCKDLTRDTLTDWAFGKDAAFVLQLVLYAVCSCMSQLCVSHAEQEYSRTRNITLCGVKLCFVDRARTKSTMRKTRRGCADVCRTMRSTSVEFRESTFLLKERSVRFHVTVEAGARVAYEVWKLGLSA